MAIPSLLCRSSRSLRIFRFVLVSLGALMLVLDIVSTASNEADAAFLARLKRPGPDRGSAVRFLPDLLTMALYTVVLVLDHRSNRITAAPSATVAPTSSSLSTLPWPTLYVLFTLFLSGFMMFRPFKVIDSLRIIVAKLEAMFPPSNSGVPGFTEWYFCYPRPTPEDVLEAGVPLTWIWSGCVVSRARDFVAILTAFLILIELAWSLREAYRKNNTNGHKELLDAVVVDDDYEKN